MVGEILKDIKRLISKNSCSRQGSQDTPHYNRCHTVD